MTPAANLISSEEWRPIPGLDHYEVSSAGRVRSLARFVGGASGSRRFIQGGFLRPSPNVDSGYLQVRIYRKTRNVHQLVTRAFLGEAPAGHEVRHLDGNPSNVKLSNLAYGTSSQNNYDIVRHGRHNNASKTHCRNGHEYSVENTFLRRGGKIRVCKICSRAAQKRFRDGR